MKWEIVSGKSIGLFEATISKKTLLGSVRSLIEISSPTPIVIIVPTVVNILSETSARSIKGCVAFES